MRRFEEAIAPMRIGFAINRLVLQTMITRLAGSGESGATLLDDLESTVKEQAETLDTAASLSPPERKVLAERQAEARQQIERFFDTIRKQAGLRPAQRSPRAPH